MTRENTIIKNIVFILGDLYFKCIRSLPEKLCNRLELLLVNGQTVLDSMPKSGIEYSGTYFRSRMTRASSFDIIVNRHEKTR